jgi:hypothetical protein
MRVSTAGQTLFIVLQDEGQYRRSDPLEYQMKIVYPNLDKPESKKGHKKATDSFKYYAKKFGRKHLLWLRKSKN